MDKLLSSITAKSLRKLMIVFLLFSFPCWLFINIPGYQLIVFVVLVMFFLFSLSNKKGIFLLNGFIFKYNMHDFFLLAFFLYIPINLLFSGSELSSWTLIISAASKILFFYFFVMSIKDIAEEPVGYVKLLILLAVVFSAIGLALFFLLALGINLPYRDFATTIAGMNLRYEGIELRDYMFFGYVKAWWKLGVGDIIRIQSFFSEPADFAYFLFMPLFLSLGMYQITRRGIYLFSLIVITLAFILTFSVGAWLSIVVPVLALLSFTFKKQLHILRSLIIPIIIMVIAVNIINNYFHITESYAFIRMFRGASFSARAITYQAALMQFLQRPLLGVGLFQSTFLIDSAWLQLMLETGIIGLVIIGGIVFCWLKYIFQNLRSLDRLDEMSSLSGFVALGFLANLIDFAFINPFFTYYFWFLTGLLLVFNYKLKKEGIDENSN